MRRQKSLRMPSRLRQSTKAGSVMVWAFVAACANTTLPGTAASTGGEWQQVGGQQPVVREPSLPGPGGETTGSGAGPAIAGSGASTGSEVSIPSSTTGSASGSGPSATGNGPNSGPSTGGIPTVGVTKTQITIDVSAPFSGVYSPISDQVYQNAFQVWQNEINAQGGIYGRKIRFAKLDNQFSPPGGVAACKQAQGDGAFMVWNALGTTNEVDCLNAARIPVLDLAASYVRNWSYAVTVQYAGTDGAPTASLMTSHWMNWQTKKIGLVYTSNEPLSVAEFNSVKDAMGKAGLPVVHSEAITANQSSYVPQMSRMKSSGVDAVALLCICADANHIISDAHAVGYSPQWFGGGVASTDITSKLGGPLFSGMLGVRVNATAESSAYAMFKSKLAKYGGDPKQADTNQMMFYGALDAFGEALRRAGPSLTREGLMAALHSLVNYDRYHMVAPITWKDRNSGVSARFPLRCCASDYTWRSLGPAAETFK